MSEYFGKEIFKLGFGLMRLPKNPDGSTDIPQVCEMVDKFFEAGGTYFDTAYVYDNGRSEAAFKAAVADRYPRDKYQLCTKLCAFMQCHDEESAKQQFYTSLERTGAGYFDFYLCHALQRSNYKKYDEYHIWEFLQEQKMKGLIRHFGFSFHGDPELLEELLTDHPEVDFVQLQINYADWDNPGTAARRNWEICKAHSKPVTIMEPVKGGSLADPIPAVKAVFDATGSKLSYAGWAIRYAASLDYIITVLSGMSNLAQMEDNLSYMKNFEPLTEEEQKVIEAAQQALNEDKSIPCTGCRYCVDGCPMNIPIPDIFAVKNNVTNFKPWDGGKRDYVIATTGKGKASECIRCGQCELSCPQNLSIIQLLEDCAASLE